VVEKSLSQQISEKEKELELLRRVWDKKIEAECKYNSFATHALMWIKELRDEVWSKCDEDCFKDYLMVSMQEGIKQRIISSEFASPDRTFDVHWRTVVDAEHNYVLFAFNTASSLERRYMKVNIFTLDYVCSWETKEIKTSRINKICAAKASCRHEKQSGFQIVDEIEFVEDNSGNYSCSWKI